MLQERARSARGERYAADIDIEALAKQSSELLTAGLEASDAAEIDEAGAETQGDGMQRMHGRRNPPRGTVAPWSSQMVAHVGPSSRGLTIGVI